MFLSSEFNRNVLRIIGSYSRYKTMHIDPYHLVTVGNRSLSLWNRIKKRYVMIDSNGLLIDVTDAFSIYNTIKDAVNSVQYCDTNGDTYIVDGKLYGSRAKIDASKYCVYDRSGSVIMYTMRKYKREVDARLAKYNRYMIDIGCVAPLTEIMRHMKHQFGPSVTMQRWGEVKQDDCLGVVGDRLAVIRKGTLVAVWNGPDQVAINRATSGGCFLFRGPHICHVMENVMPVNAPTRVRVYDAKLQCISDRLFPRYTNAPHYSCHIWPLSDAAEESVMKVQEYR